MPTSAQAAGLALTAAHDGALKDGVLPSKRERTKTQNRDAILDAARLVFAELGYGATTVRDIIRRTGLASGTFYNYFKSKEEVFEAIQDQSALELRPRLREERLRAATFADFVEATFRTFFNFVTRDRGSYALMRRHTGINRVRIDSAETLAGFEELRADLVQAVAKGMLPKVDPDLLSRSMIGIAFEVADLLAQQDRPDPADAIKFATAMVLGGLPALPVKGKK